MSLQAALAFVLANDQTREKLRDRPLEVQRNFGLDDEEMSFLLSLDPKRLALSAAICKGRRLDRIRWGLPATITALKLAQRESLLNTFVRASWPEVKLGETSLAPRECHLFTNYLHTCEHDEISAVLSNLADFELAQLDLSLSCEASLCAQQLREHATETRTLINGHINKIDSLQVVLGKHVQLKRFNYDVMSLYQTLRRGLQCSLLKFRAIDNYVTFVKNLQMRQSIVPYRTGEILFKMLNHCKQPCSTAEMLAIAGPANEQLAIDALRDSLHRSVLLFLHVNAGPTALGPTKSRLVPTLRLTM
jgi:hypothetical protein